MVVLRRVGWSSSRRLHPTPRTRRSSSRVRPSFRSSVPSGCSKAVQAAGYGGGYDQVKSPNGNQRGHLWRPSMEMISKPLVTGGGLPGATPFQFTPSNLFPLGADRYRDALESHRRLLREVFQRHSGHEVDTQGDSFFVAFGRAQDAVRAAGEAQRTLRGARVAGGPGAPGAHGHPQLRGDDDWRGIRRCRCAPRGTHLRGRPRRPGPPFAHDVWPDRGRRHRLRVPRSRRTSPQGSE